MKSLSTCACMVCFLCVWTEEGAFRGDTVAGSRPESCPSLLSVLLLTPDSESALRCNVYTPRVRVFTFYRHLYVQTCRLELKTFYLV